MTAGSSVRPGRRLAWAWGSALFAVAVVVLWIAYLHLSRTQRVESDGASNALQAWDMLHGNPLLRGWTVTDVSFYTTELPEYMIVEAIRGLNADVLHVAAALSYALLVPLAALLAKGRATGREAWIRMAIAVGIMVAPEPGAGVFIVLFQPDHIGTQVPMMATWLVLERMPRRWYAPLVMGILLTWIGVADKIVLLIGVLPVCLVCAARALRAWRGMMPWRDMPRLAWRREGLRAAWFEIWLAVAALVSVEAADLVVRVVHALGGYTVLPVGTGLAGLGQLPTHIRLATDGVLGLYGANFQGPPHGVDLAFAIVHLVGVGLAIWALWLALRYFFRDDDLIVQILAVSIVVNVGAYLVSGKPSAYWSVREMAGILPAGAVLAGRLIGPRLTAALAARRAAGTSAQAGLASSQPGLAGSQPGLAGSQPGLAGVQAGGAGLQRFYRGLSAALAVVLLAYLAALGYGASGTPVPGVGQDLAGWLRAHDLTYGLAEYGLANSTTMASGNNVRIRPVVVAAQHKLAAGPHEYNTNFYDPRDYDANFVALLNTPAALDPMTRAQAIAAFGPPAREYHYKTYLILTWNKNLLAQLGPPAPD